MKAKKEKFNFKSQGIDFKNISLIPLENSGSYLGYASMGAVSQVVRQYIKAKYGIKHFQISTDSYSMGDSVRVYLNPVYITDNMYEIIQADLNEVFQSGYFNGMEDIYEYTHNVETRIEGAGYKYQTKWMQVSHKPKYGTKQYDEYENLNELIKAA